MPDHKNEKSQILSMKAMQGMKLVPNLQHTVHKELHALTCPTMENISLQLFTLEAELGSTVAKSVAVIKVMSCVH